MLNILTKFTFTIQHTFFPGYFDHKLLFHPNSKSKHPHRARNIKMKFTKQKQKTNHPNIK